MEIVCSRMKESNPKVAREICDLLGEQYYVPLLRDDDLCLLPQVGNPWSPNFDSPTSPVTKDQLLMTYHSPVSPASPISPSFKVRGFAGPMSPTQAEVFHRLWKSNVTSSPTRHSKDRIASLRLTDQEKGLERVGRELAAERGITWKEYWDFLGEFTNLSTDDGLAKLESFLKEKYKQFMLERGALDASDLANRLGVEHKLHEDTNETNHEIQG
ncbi:Ankyrin repeat and LEM domain-containing protein 2-like 2 [Homarus americanus]|uniref:Ankyrin repeat and LEM domain-containing protein 2-like 2 n=1 Tax=Homarus americanus TaxID=6706 RepID=A0A8J5JQ77_HOMAM|nr:Ankyrin repeat and LEM domain-containing protein 2-like 2 [Homarus americanus]